MNGTRKEVTNSFPNPGWGGKGEGGGFMHAYSIAALK